MLEINNLSIEINQKVIINNLNLIINKGDKLAIVGEEGNGKSTLLKVLSSNCDYAKVTGNIDFKRNTVGYLEQMINGDDLNKNIYNYLFKDEDDFYNKINEYYRLNSIFNLSDDFLEKESIKYLSGGEKIKLQLLKILLNDPDILLLDEPTNDLDIESLVWLENFINNSKKPIIYVSHDETLLSNTANMILHLELVSKKTKSRYTLVNTNYDDYIDNRIRHINKTNQISKKEKDEHNKQQAKLSQIMNRVNHELNTISRKDPHGGKMLKRKMKTVKVQQRKLETEELTEKVDVEEGISFFFRNINIPCKKTVLDFKLDKLTINSKVLSNNVELKINGSDHIVIIGKNGCGKTTLLKKIYEYLIDRTDIKVSYMPQDYDNILLLYKTPLQFLCNEKEDNETISLARTLMGSMKFTKEEMLSSISNLSGGSKAKLFIIKCILDESNVLILDEPTRNVSPLSNPIIRKELSRFKGTIISVSHDRKYITEVCNKIYEMNSNGLTEISK